MPTTIRPTGSAGSRVAVFRALALGDFLCAVPALRAIRAGLPEARISLIALGRSRELVHRFRHVVDELVEFPGWPGIPETDFRAPALPPFLARVHARPYDLAINLHGSGLHSNAFVALLGARRMASFTVAEGWPAPGPDVLPYPAHLHEIHRNLALVRHLGLPVDGDHLEFPLSSRDHDGLRRLLGPEALEPGSYAVLHPGASTPARRWPLERFIPVARALEREGLRIVVTGSRGERALTRTLADRVGGRAIDLGGRTDLGALGSVVAGARLVVANDTGVSHIAVAVRTPSVVVFTGSDPARWAPLDGTRHVAVGAGVPDACPAAAAGVCQHDHPRLHPVAAPTIVEVDDVVAAAARLLHERDARVA